MSALPSAAAQAPHVPRVESRLPEVGTTIFTVMSALATEHGAVNLGQGFPDFDCDPRLVAAVADAMQRGLNQYPPMAGVPALRLLVGQEQPLGALGGAHLEVDVAQVGLGHPDQASPARPGRLP